MQLNYKNKLNIMKLVLNSIFISLAFFFLGCGESEAPNDKGQIPENGVQIGSQIWMKKNLDVKTFRNGEEIFHARNQSEWERSYIEKIPAWSYYEDLEGNGRIYGIIYNYYAIKDSRGLAPINWRIPTISDWNELFEFNGGALLAGKKLKSKTYWINESGTNESGFDALPGGERFLGGYFDSNGLVSSFWTASVDSNGDLISVGISDIDENSKIFISSIEIRLVKPGYYLPGFYLRCIKE